MDRLVPIRWDPQRLRNIKNKYKDIGHITVKLYNSLALIGQGHLTRCNQTCTKSTSVDFIEINQVKHPNNMLFSIYDKEEI